MKLRFAARKPPSAIRQRRWLWRVWVILALTPPLFLFRLRFDVVREVFFSSDGRHLLSEHEGRTDRFWEAATGRIISNPGDLATYPRSRQFPRYEFRYTRMLSLYARQEDPDVVVLNPPGQKPVRFRSRLAEVVALDLSSDGGTLVWASRDKTIHLWDVAGSRELRRFRAHESPVTAVALSRDGRLLASASQDKTLRLWETAASQAPRVLSGHTRAVTCVVFSPDRRLLVSGSADGTIRLWSVASGEEIWRAGTYPLGIAWRAWTELPGSWLVFIPWLVLGPLAGIFLGIGFVLTWPRAGAVGAVSVGRDGKLLALVDGCDVYLLDIATGRELWSRLSVMRATDWDDSSEARGAGSTVLFLDAPVSSGEATLAEAYGSDILLRSLHSGQVLRRVGGRGDLTATVSFDGRLAASGGSMQSHGAFSGSTQSYDLSLVDTTSRQERSLQGHQKAVRCLTFSPDGSMLASGSADQTIRLWETATAAEQACLSGHGGAVTCLAFSPDGSLLASGSEDLTVRLWDVAAGAERTKLEGHTGPVTSVAFSPDGRWLASASADTTVRLWEVSTGRELFCLEGHSAKVNALAFSPEGAFLVSGGDDKTVRAWDPSTGAQLWQLTAKRVGIFGYRFERA